MPDSLRTIKSPPPNYVQSIFGGEQPKTLKLSTDDGSGTVCFDEFSQDTWIEPPETAILPTTSVEN